MALCTKVNQLLIYLIFFLLYIPGGSYYNLAVEAMSLMRQHIMEASDGKNDFYLTNQNADKMLAFGFEYPMSGTMTAYFADDSRGEIKAEIRKYIEITYSPNPITDFDISINWSLSGQSFRWSLRIEPNNYYPVEKKKYLKLVLENIMKSLVFLFVDQQVNRMVWQHHLNY